ncbi:MAG: DUF1643 domain-containing protein [Chloroflexi bacterium]|nr:DUF1643 domain-containing protein [Chloroflexota bacterium]
MRSGAVFDSTGQYRYLLWREWEVTLPRLTVVMLNPSTADAITDDPTIRRVCGFARSWGFGRVDVVNLFARRATSPRELFAAPNPEGTGNEGYLRDAAAGCVEVLLAWGAHGTFRDAGARALDLLQGNNLTCLGMTRGGEPRHPLYLAASTPRVPWRR